MGITSYTESKADKICNLLNDGQTIAYACEKMGIRRATVYGWMKNRPEFAKMVEEAKQNYIDNCPSKLKKAAKNRIREVIETGAKFVGREDYVLTTIHEVPYFNKETGQNEYKVKWRQVHTYNKNTENNLGTPQWAIDRVLPKPVGNLEEAVQVLAQHGLKPMIADGDLFKEWLNEQLKERQEQSGDQDLDEERVINEIKARFLGLDDTTIQAEVLESTAL